MDSGFPFSFSRFSFGGDDGGLVASRGGGRAKKGAWEEKHMYPMNLQRIYDAGSNSADSNIQSTA